MITGIHHITAMCGDPQSNVDFYSGLLGLRFVKVNVNMDDPGTYHFYYGDRVGSPGSAMTFFPWPNAFRGSVGKGQVAATAFSIPQGSLQFWKDRIFDSEEFMRFGQLGLELRDPDGMPIELIEAEDSREPWLVDGVGTEHAIRGFHSATLWSHDPKATTLLLTNSMNFRVLGEEDGRLRLATGTGEPHQIVDIGDIDGVTNGRMGTGVHHHIAFRVADDDAQKEAVEKLQAQGMRVTPVQERFYFRSVYFREPGHVLFELATDTPGFTADEPVEQLGEKLCLPPWFEAQRSEIERALPRFTTPQGVSIP